MVLPCSMVWMRLNSSKFSSINSLSRNRHLTRARGGVLLQSGKASCAAVTAASISLLVDMGTWAITLSVAGFTTFSLGPLESTHSPLIQFLSCKGSLIGSSRIDICPMLLSNHHS